MNTPPIVGKIIQLTIKDKPKLEDSESFKILMEAKKRLKPLSNFGDDETSEAFSK
jgi:hypothetical protein